MTDEMVHMIDAYETKLRTVRRHVRSDLELLRAALYCANHGTSSDESKLEVVADHLDRVIGSLNTMLAKLG
jgi:Mg2+ and Co2+ transporter CorA